MEKTTLYLPEDIRWMLRMAAKRTGQSQAELMREALRLFLQDHDRPHPRSIGIARNAKFQAADDEEWLKEHWRPD